MTYLEQEAKEVIIKIPNKIIQAEHFADAGLKAARNE